MRQGNQRLQDDRPPTIYRMQGELATWNAIQQHVETAAKIQGRLSKEAQEKANKA